MLDLPADIARAGTMIEASSICCNQCSCLQSQVMPGVHVHHVYERLFAMHGSM